MAIRRRSLQRFIQRRTSAAITVFNPEEPVVPTPPGLEGPSWKKKRDYLFVILVEWGNPWKGSRSTSLQLLRKRKTKEKEVGELTVFENALGKGGRYERAEKQLNNKSRYATPLPEAWQKGKRPLLLLHRGARGKKFRCERGAICRCIST